MISFDTQPDRYHHWKLDFDGPVATLRLDIAKDKPLVPGYKLKLNSYDLGVDIELADAISRLSADHQEVIMLRNLQHLPFDEVAERMGRSRPAVQMLWMRAIRKLEELMRGEESE